MIITQNNRAVNEKIIFFGIGDYYSVFAEYSSKIQV